MATELSRQSPCLARASRAQNRGMKDLTLERTRRARSRCAGTCLLVLALAAGPALAATPEALKEGTITAAEDLGVGVTFPLLLTLEYEGVSLRGVFKDIDLRVPHRDDGPDPHIADRWKHEVAAFRIDRLIGLGLVPVTVVREREGREGSLQLWIEDAWTLKESGRKEPPELRVSRRLFDALVFNPDRNPGNMLVAREGPGMWLIDHSRAFRALPRLPASLGDAPVEVPETLRAGLAALSRESLDREVGDLLAPEQIETLLARRDLLLEQAP